MTRWGLVTQDDGEIVAVAERLQDAVAAHSEHPGAILVPLAERPERPREV